MSSIGPFATDREAAQAARALGGPVRESWSILLRDQNEALLRAACERSGVVLGAYDEEILAWMSGWEDFAVMVLAGLVCRAYEAGKAAR